MFPVLVASLLAIAAPPAGVEEGLACVIDQTSPEDIDWVGAHVLAGQDLAHSEQLGRLSAHLADCSERLGWDDAHALRVSTLSVSQMGRTVAVRRLADAGIDSASLDRWFAAQSEDFRTRAFVDMSEDDAAAVIETLAPDVLSAEVFERHGELVGGYLASLVVALRIERGLPIE
jgi:hypothetical protein